jgi:hypothetical protein
MLSFGFYFEDVGLRGREVEVVAELARQGLVRPPQVGERRWRDEASVRPMDDVRDERRHIFDDPGAGPSHAPLVEVGKVLEDFLHWLEVVLQELIEGM